MATQAWPWYPGPTLFDGVERGVSESMTNHEIGERLRQRRKNLRLRQRDLAELAGVTLRGLTDLENGRANPTINQLAKIADVLGLELQLAEKSIDASS